MACCGKGKSKKSFKDLILERRNAITIPKRISDADKKLLKSQATQTSPVILPKSLSLKKIENKKKIIDKLFADNKNSFITDPKAIAEMSPRQRRIQRRNERILLRNERMRLKANAKALPKKT